METLPVELVAHIIGVTNRKSKKRLTAIESSWQPIATEYHEGEFNLFIDLRVNSAAPSIAYSVFMKRLVSARIRHWSDGRLKDAHLIRDVYLSIANNFKEKTSYDSDSIEEDIRFITKVFGFARHAKRMHLTLNVKSNGENPPRQCELLKRLLDLIPAIPVATVDRNNALIKPTEEVQQRHKVFNVLISTFQRLRIPYVPAVAWALVDAPVEIIYPGDIAEADSYLERYYLRRNGMGYVGRIYNGLTTFATFYKNGLCIDFSALREYQKTTNGHIMPFTILFRHRILKAIDYCVSTSVAVIYLFLFCLFLVECTMYVFDIGFPFILFSRLH
uniref:F-box domain-containing protein n=1 Tax=Steinernema glaseri TaxID=37863 RepID=A0A1I8ATA9_9BILA